MIEKIKTEGDVANGEQAVSTTAPSTEVSEGPKQKKGKRKTCCVLAVILAVIVAMAVAFGVFAVIELKNRESRIVELESKLAIKDDSDDEMGQGGTDESNDEEGRGERDEWGSLVMTPEKWLNRDVPLDEVYVSLSSDMGVIGGSIDKGHRANCEIDGKFYPVKAKTNVTINWDQINSSYGWATSEVVKNKTGTEVFDISDQINPDRVVEIRAQGFGQAVGWETLFFLMDDGTVEYIPVVQVAKTGEVKSAGKLQGVEKVIRLSIPGSLRYGGCSGGGQNMYAQRSDGGIYSIYSIIEGTGNYD